MSLSTRKLPSGSVEATLGGLTVVLRERDGYINATRLCKDGGKQFGNWTRLDSSNEFLTELSKTVEGDLIQVHSLGQRPT